MQKTSRYYTTHEMFLRARLIALRNLILQIEQQLEKQQQPAKPTRRPRRRIAA